MTDGAISRRALLSGAGMSLAGGLAGCSRLTSVFPRSRSLETVQQSERGAITGRVTDVHGTPVEAATVSAFAPDRDDIARTSTDGSGQFGLETSRPVLLRVTADGYKERVIAARPRQTHRVRLASAAGTATISFGGDVMFGRRFYEEGTDRLNPREPIDGSLADHREVLAGIRPLLSSSDLASVNLETPLSTSDWRHPTKLSRYSSRPVAAQALAEAGVGYVALGNNHAFDALTPGLRDTVETLEETGIAYSGAGTSATAAWEPAVVDVSGLSVAFVSCTTIDGTQYDLDWAADSGSRGEVTVEDGGQSLTVPPGVGVASATEERIERRVEEAAERATLVVVQIHGGEPYRPTPTAEMRALTETAARAGADLVVNHHPHVVGGIDTIDSTVVAWSLGNLVFDRKLWPTFPTYLLTVDLAADGVRRVAVDPLLIQGFAPQPVVGKPNRHVAWKTAGYSTDGATLTAAGLSYSRSVPDRERETRTLPGGEIYSRETGWVSDVVDGPVRLGRDLLPTGTVESIDVDSTGYEGQLWRFDRTLRRTGPSFGDDGSGGFKLDRVGSNSAPAVISNSRRIPIDGDLTLACRYRTSASDGLVLEAGWYADTGDPRFSTDRWELDSTGGDWTLLTTELSPPTAATHLNVLVSLEPPGGGRRTAYLDDLRLVSWADSGTTSGRGFDHLRTETDATVEFTAPVRADGAAWERLGVE